MREVRKLRHWKQRFNKNAMFIWRRPARFAGKAQRPGDPIPDELASNKAKLRRFWESGVIELAQFETPDVLTGLVESAADKQARLAHAELFVQMGQAAIDFEEFDVATDDDFNRVDDDPGEGTEL
jgi:hypothetical protein